MAAPPPQRGSVRPLPPFEMRQLPPAEPMQTIAMGGKMEGTAPRNPLQTNCKDRKLFLF